MLTSVLLAAVTWFPATNWVERPDPVASPHARKGGILRFNGSQAPKSFNEYVDNNTYTRMTFELMYECLLSTDPETLEFTPCIARRWSVSDDGTEFTFVLDTRARWSDGRPLTAADVKWTFDTVMDPKNLTGTWKTTLGAFDSPVIIDTHTVRLRKKPGSEKNWRDLLHCSFFPILPKHAFEGKDFNALNLLDAPVNGPYRLSRVEEQIETEYARVPDWWRVDHPSCRGMYNFDRILLRYYADNENAFEAFKKRTIDVYPVYTARIMHNETHGERFDKNWVLQRRVRNHKPLGFQGFAMNQRRFPFNDPAVRQAMSMLIDRETMNRTMMYGEYFLLRSYYPDLYDATHPCTNRLYRYDVEGAKKLLAAAGWTRDSKGALVKNGRPLRFTFLSRSATDEKFLSLFNHALTQCGISMEIVRKDFAGWMRDMDDFAFDMTWSSWGASVFRNPETMFLSSEADRRGSNNLTGFKSAEVDRLIQAEKGMTTMAERMDAYRRIDALIHAQTPYAFLWQTAETRLLYWNKFGTPRTVLGRHTKEDGVLLYWWYDADRADELKRAMEQKSCLPSVPLRVEFDAVVGQP
jgi:microcin C transport system substrate-binding protein